MSTEARTIRKLGVRILPFVFLLYIVAFLDRINIGFAAEYQTGAVGRVSEFMAVGLTARKEGRECTAGCVGALQFEPAVMGLCNPAGNGKAEPRTASGDGLCA